MANARSTSGLKRGGKCSRHHPARPVNKPPSSARLHGTSGHAVAMVYLPRAHDTLAHALPTPTSRERIATPRRFLGTQAAVGLAVFATAMALASSSEGGQSTATPALPASAPAAAGLPASFTGAPPPVPPAVVSRDLDGHVTIRAVRLTAPVRLDGQL